MADPDGSARVYIDSVRMEQARRAIREAHPALASTLDTDTLVARYIFDLGLHSARKQAPESGR